MVVATCPNCGARYQLTARQIGPNGRTLKCAKCTHQWFMPPVVPSVDVQVPAHPAPTEPALPEDKVPELPPIPESQSDLTGFATLGSRPRWHRRVTATPLGMTILTATLLLTFLGLGVWYILSPEPQEPTGHTPTPLPSDVITPPSLVLSDIERSLTRRGETWVLTISGRLTNTGKESLPIPELRVQLLDKHGIELDFWPAELTTTSLKAGEETHWQARFLNPALPRIASYRAFFRNAPAVITTPATATAPALDDTPTTAPHGATH